MTPISSSPLRDQQGRQFEYLRLSVTDACNYHCQYCLPNGYQKTEDEGFLNVREIENIVQAMSSLGLWKVRLTGGEPTLRKDLTTIITRIAATPGIRKIALTTNGHNLVKKAAEWRTAGLTAINVSVDSLNPSNFHHITGHDHLPQILDGIALSSELGFEQIKINTVLLKGLNDHELPTFLEWARDRAVSLRFIELMQTGDNANYFKQHHLAGTFVIEKLLTLGWQEQARRAGAGPAREFAHPDYRGTIGVISPYAKDFCQTCNRLRISARGALRLCLFGQGGYSLRHLMQTPSQHTQLMQAINELMDQKQPSHLLHFGVTGSTPHLASIGG